jgi:hypothetical protein
MLNLNEGAEKMKVKTSVINCVLVQGTEFWVRINKNELESLQKHCTESGIKLLLDKDEGHYKFWVIDRS